MDERIARRVQSHTNNVNKSKRLRQLKSTRKKLRQNLSGKAPRVKSWEPTDQDEWEDLAHEQSERVMPLADRNRGWTGRPNWPIDWLIIGGYGYISVVDNPPLGIVFVSQCAASQD